MSLSSCLGAFCGSQPEALLCRDDGQHVLSESELRVPRPVMGRVPDLSSLEHQCCRAPQPPPHTARVFLTSSIKTCSRAEVSFHSQAAGSKPSPRVRAEGMALCRTQLV